MKLETKRLELIPLDGRQLDLLLSDLPQLEQELSCCYEGNEMVGPVAQAVEEQRKAIKESIQNDDYLYFTFWQLLVKESRTIVGSVCLKGRPNEIGEVEIGYGLSHQHEKNGYMTEAVTSLIDWLLTQPQVRAVVAETNTHNEASNWVLKRCGLTIAKKCAEEMLWWRISKPVKSTNLPLGGR